MNKDDCECGLDEKGNWSDKVFDLYGCGCEPINIENLRLAKKVLLSLIDDSYDTLRNCPEARQDPSNIHATVKELKGAIDEIDRHISMEEDDDME